MISIVITVILYIKYMLNLYLLVNLTNVGPNIDV